MGAIRLSARGRQALGDLARHSADGRQTRRALALLDLDAGEPVGRVAGRYRVSRSTVYEWVSRGADPARRPGERLRDAARPGRPAVTREVVTATVAGLLPTAPTAHGYRHPTWTAPLLVAHLARRGVTASEATVRRAVHALGYRWKRPRFVLSRRAVHWRQAKGG